MDNEKISKHESYGMVSVHRTHGGMSNLFGSSIQHGNTIRLAINLAEVHRKYNTDFYYPRDQIIEIELSPVQFSELITNMNTTGVPCTIKKLQGKRMSECPSVNKKQEFENELVDDMKMISNRMAKLTKRTEEILNSKKAPTKAEKQEILREIDKLHQEVASNLPFAYECFNEQMEKTVGEMKGEIDAFVTHQITSLGIEALKDKFNVKMLEE